MRDDFDAACIGNVRQPAARGRSFADGVCMGFMVGPAIGAALAAIVPVLLGAIA